MANLVIPRREIWTQQPQRNLGINRINRIAQGLEFVLNPPTFGLNCATSKLHTITKFGVASIESSAYGIAVSSNNGGYTLASNGIESKLTSAISAIVCFLPRSGSETIFGSVGASYGTVNWRIRQSADYLFVEVMNASGVMATCAFYVANWFGQITPIIVGFSYLAESGVVNAWCSVATDQSAAQTGLVNAASVPLNFANNLGGDGNYVGKTYFAAIWSRAISKTEFTALSANPWQIFAPRETRLFVPVGGGGSVNANASGALSAVAVTAPSASASGSASATGACAAITITAPTATASAGGSASASGSFAALSISPATATATATKSATASVAFAAISLSAPTATASGTTAGGANATCTPAQITISHATAIAIGSAVASGGYQSIGITAPTGSASVGNGNATASGTWAAISITAPAAYASSGFIRAPSGIGPTVIQPGSYRMRQSATSRPSNTGGRRY